MSWKLIECLRYLITRYKKEATLSDFEELKKELNSNGINLKFNEKNTNKNGKLNSYNIATAVGGLMEQPEIYFENHDTIMANSEKEALKIYNKKWKCSFFYGKIL